VVAGDIQKGHVGPADDVLEVVERQVSAAEHQVGVLCAELVAVEGFVDLVGDGEDARRLT